MLTAEGIPISFLCVEPRLGGGTTIATVLEEVAREKGPALCVADSDRKWPWSSEGLTARALRAKYAQLASREELPYLGILVLGVHEAKNLVRVTVLERLLGSSRQRTRGDLWPKVSKLRTLVPNWPSCTQWEVLAWTHFDLKNGLDLSEGASSEWTWFLEEYSVRYAGATVIPGVCQDILTHVVQEIEEQISGNKDKAGLIWRKLLAAPFAGSIKELV
jgi:hypothetical protein